MYRARAFQFFDAIPFNTASTTQINDCQASLGVGYRFPGRPPTPSGMSHHSRTGGILAHFYHGVR